MQKNRARRKEAPNTNTFSYIKRCIIFIPVFLIVSLLCATVIAFIFYNLNDPSSLSELCAGIILYLSFTVSACVFLRRISHKRIVWGFIYGAAILLLLYSVSLIFGNGFDSLSKTILKGMLPFLGAILGAIFNKAQAKGSKRRKRRT